MAGRHTFKPCTVPTHSVVASETMSEDVSNVAEVTCSADVSITVTSESIYCSLMDDTDPITPSTVVP